jgi:transposase
MICFDDLPFDPLLLKHMLIEIAAMVEALSKEKTALDFERDAALAQRDAALQENEKLLLLLSHFKRMLFGRRSEKADPQSIAAPAFGSRLCWWRSKRERSAWKSRG